MNQNNPKVSVCLASYNHEKFIGQTIQSVIDQTYSNWELIISDDASTDNSREVIQHYANQYPEKITVIFNEINQGISGNFNTAFKLATGKYIALLGTDDLMLPTRLEKQVAFMEDENNQQVGAVLSEIDFINEHHERYASDSIFANPITNLRWQLLSGNFLNAPSAMIRKTAFDQIGLYHDEFPMLQDFESWLLILDTHEIVRLTEKLTLYRVHGNNVSISSNPRVSGNYETMICVIKAIQRWSNTPEIIFDFLKQAKNTSFEQKALARAFYLLSQKALGIGSRYGVMSDVFSPFSTTFFAYSLILDAVKHDPSEILYQDFLKQIYHKLGDYPRANQEGFLKSKDLRLECFSFEKLNPTVNQQYPEWKVNNQFKETDSDFYLRKFENPYFYKPLIHLVFYVNQYNQEDLQTTLNNLSNQIYPLFYVSVLSEVENLSFELPENVEGKFLTIINTSQEKFGFSFYQLIQSVQTDWVGVFSAGTLFEPQTLLSLGTYINLYPNWKFIYTDEDNLSVFEKQFVKPQFKSKFDLPLLANSNFIGDACFIHIDALINMNKPFQYQNYLYYWCFEVLKEYEEKAIGHINQLLIHTPENLFKEFKLEEYSKILKNYFAEIKQINVECQQHSIYQTISIKASDLDFSEKITLIIDVKTQEDIDSIDIFINYLAKNTSNYELISQIILLSEDSLELNSKYFICNKNSNYLDNVNNPYIIFLKPDVQFTNNQWLNELINLNIIYGENIGFIAGRYLDRSNNRILSTFGGFGENGTSFYGDFPSKERGYLNRAVSTQSALIVNLIGSIVKTNVLKQCDTNLSHSECCLYLHSLGFKNIYTPTITIKIDKDKHLIEDYIDLKQFSKVLAKNAYYNNSLSITSPFLLDNRFPAWDSNIYDENGIIIYAKSNLSSLDSILSPFKELSKITNLSYKLIENQNDFLSPIEIDRIKPYAIVINYIPTIEELKILAKYKHTQIMLILDHLTRPNLNTDLIICLKQLNLIINSCIVFNRNLKNSYAEYIDEYKIKIFVPTVSKDVWKTPQNLNSEQVFKIGCFDVPENHQQELFLLTLIEQSKLKYPQIQWFLEKSEFASHIDSELVTIINSPFNAYTFGLNQLNLNMILKINSNESNLANLSLFQCGILNAELMVADDFYLSEDLAECVEPISLGEINKAMSILETHVNNQDYHFSKRRAFFQFVNDYHLLENNLAQWINLFK